MLTQEVKDESEHYAKLESIGFDVGKRMLIRSDRRICFAYTCLPARDVQLGCVCVCVFSCMDRESSRNPREVIKEDIAIVKYICQHFWTSVFGKKISKLQTDNYVRKHTREIM